VLSAVHLRDEEGVEPAIKHFPSATHEIGLWALDPESEPNPDEWRVLTPENVCVQVACTSDDTIREVLKLIADGLVNGIIAAEDGGEALSQEWQRCIIMTIEHLVTGGHGSAETL
jgi:hypothetical protein